MITHDLQDYLFDLNGYLILENVIAPDHLAALNAAFDGFPELGFKEWWGDVQRLDNNARAGMELQNIVHAGKPFENLIDHPAWVDRMRRYCGEDQTRIQGLCRRAVAVWAGEYSGGADGYRAGGWRHAGYSGQP